MSESPPAKDLLPVRLATRVFLVTSCVSLILFLGVPENFSRNVNQQSAGYSLHDLFHSPQCVSPGAAGKLQRQLCCYGSIPQIRGNTFYCQPTPQELPSAILPLSALRPIAITAVQITPRGAELSWEVTAPSHFLIYRKVAHPPAISPTGPSLQPITSYPRNTWTLVGELRVKSSATLQRGEPQVAQFTDKIWGASGIEYAIFSSAYESTAAFFADESLRLPAS